MKELVTILDAALAADLGKRQWAVFAAVLRQTLGYRKLADDLSARRLSQLTGIQRNHIWQAKQELVDKGLLVSAPGKFGEVLGFAVLHEKLSGGFSAYPSPAPVRATDSGLSEEPPKEVSHVKLPLTAATAIPPDLGVPASQFGPETIPKQDTTVSNHTQSNHNNSTAPLPCPQPSSLIDPPVGGLGVTGISVVAGNTDLSATDSGCPASRLSGGLEWPDGLVAGMRQEMASLLCGLAAQTAQAVLDVLAMGLEAGKVRKPLAYLRVLVRAARNGELVTAEAQVWREQRLRERTSQVSPVALERAGELAWIQQLANLQGLPVDVVATQLGVQMRLPRQRTVEKIGTLAGDVPNPQWMRDRYRDLPVDSGGIRSVGA
ncbi:replication protein [Thiothrix fructosivorans]|uniref:Replication protein n=1 Tax=Thiothrix fructosivorans TaxID=111770 RepID=A0A8B0SPD8_9GAMM|nr:replication protein [Thiothrix fructosivorans]MBO0611504.1 replication protein [Thiothrix fructosivorans]QTX13075.1 replication protein [Thiothrix fructosivorans]